MIAQLTKTVCRVSVFEVISAESACGQGPFAMLGTSDMPLTLERSPNSRQISSISSSPHFQLAFLHNLIRHH